jgi:hypothetical protein
MREIKFRGVNYDGELVYGLPAKDLPNSTAYYDEYSYRLCWHPESGGQANCPIKNGTLMQYTGLKDKNGVEIYENDLISCLSYPFYSNGLNNYVAEIVWYDDAAMFGYEYHRISDRVTGNVVGGSLDELEDIEIIGNIHQNPELLKEETTCAQN